MADNLQPGDRASTERLFSQADVAEFARLSGDDNPIHLDTGAALAAGFDGPIVHGALVIGLFSRLLGTRLPGSGTIYLGQEIRFLRAVYPDIMVTAHVEVVAIREDKPVVTLRTWAEASGQTVVEGTATVLVRRLAPPA